MVCEKLASRLQVVDGTLVLGDPLPPDEDQAASKLQARIRGRNERLNPTPPPPKTQDVAASKLQSRIRGKNDRERLAREKKAREAPLREQRRQAREAQIARAAQREIKRLDALARRRLEQKTRNPYIATPFEERTRRAELEAGLVRPVRTSSRRRVCAACADTRIRSRTPSSPRRTPPPAAVRHPPDPRASGW